MANKRKSLNKRAPTKKRDHKQLTATDKPDEDQATALARTVLRPTVQAAVTLKAYGANGDLELSALIESLSEQTQAAIDGDLSRGEAMLAAQAHTLDAIFNCLAQRAVMNMGEYMQACNTYLRLALRAQSQARGTWETLATIQNPPVVSYAKQANIAQGPQQVNNAACAATGAPQGPEKTNPQSKLLEKTNGERLDIGATGTTGRADPSMATVGEIDGAEDR